MMDYQDSMAGLDQIFQAILGQAMKPTSVEVDEMQQGQQAQADQMAQIAAMGQNSSFSTGAKAMNEVEQALASGKKKNADYVPFASEGGW